MRYSSGIRHSAKSNILHNHLRSSLISLSILLLVLLLLFFSVNVGHLNSHQLFNGFWISLLRVSAAYVLALVLAMLLAFFITFNHRLENLLLPIFDVLQSFPSFALFPVLVHALAHEPEAVIVLVLVITIIWPILFSIIGGLKNRRQDLEEAAAVFGARGFKRLRYFTLPELWPSIVNGSIVGWGEGWEFIIGAELLVHVSKGIGVYLGNLGETQQNSLLAFGIVSLMLFLFVVNKLVWLPLLHRSTKYQSES